MKLVDEILYIEEHHLHEYFQSQTIQTVIYGWFRVLKMDSIKMDHLFFWMKFVCFEKLNSWKNVNKHFIRYERIEEMCRIFGTATSLMIELSLC